MSHFTCLVVADDYEAALQPFHEYECTGAVDQYVIDVDRTDEARATYATKTETRMRELATGTLFDRFDDKGEWVARFSVPDPMSFSSGRRKTFVPDGFVEVEVPTSTVTPFAEWAAEYYGAPIVRVDDDAARPFRVAVSDRPAGTPADPAALAAARMKSLPRFSVAYGYTVVDTAGEAIVVVDRTNPQAEWDWYQTGPDSRWPDKLLMKDGSSGTTARAGDIDWDGMIAAAAAKAAADYDRITAIVDGRPYKPWRQYIAEFDAQNADRSAGFDAVRDAHDTQPVYVDACAAEKDSWGIADLLGEISKSTRSGYIERKGMTDPTTWALLHGGRWTERGGMGWWGASDATEVSVEEYVVGFWAAVRALPADTRVTVVDCHI